MGKESNGAGPGVVGCSTAEIRVARPGYPGFIYSAHVTRRTPSSRHPGFHGLVCFDGVRTSPVGRIGARILIAYHFKRENPRMKVLENLSENCNRNSNIGKRYSLEIFRGWAILFSDKFDTASPRLHMTGLLPGCAAPLPAAVSAAPTGLPGE